MKSSTFDSLKLMGGQFVAVSALAVTVGVASATACSLENWSNNSVSAAPSTMVASQPDGNGSSTGGSEAVARFAGLCGSQAAGAVPFVQDDRPGGTDTIAARFYVLNSDNGDAVVYQGRDAGDSEVFNIAYSAGNIVLTAGALSVSSPATVGWNAVEYSYNVSGGGSLPALSLIVNGGTPAVAGSAPAAVGIDNVRMGNLSSAASTLTFDGYEAHLSTPVGVFLAGDANDDGAINALDLSFLVQEIINGSLATGVPDANADGVVNALDLSVLVNIIIGG